MNVQFAIPNSERGEAIYVLEVNPRASRTVPFLSKATGVPVAEIATLCMLGLPLSELLPAGAQWRARHVAVKAPVFPFARFPGVDTVLGPEMRSTGEVMGIDRDFPLAFAKAQSAAGNALPLSGTAFVSVKDGDKPKVITLARRLSALGFKILATSGTHAVLAQAGVPSELVRKVAEGRPHVVDRIADGGVALVINTTIGRQALLDSYSIRRETLMHGVPYCVTMEAARAAVEAIEALKSRPFEVRTLQEFHGRS